MSNLFAGTWTLITGASSGLGEVFAREIAAMGGNLVLSARSLDRLDALAAQLRRPGVEAISVRSDLAAEGGAEALARAVDATGITVTHLVNNAGFGSSGPFAQLDAAREVEMVRLNCEAVVALSRHYLPGLIERRTGGIIHVASVAAFQPTPYMATYAATKAFVLSLSLAMAAEAQPFKVRVMALCPGPVPTGFQAAAGIGAIAGPLKVAALSPEVTVARGLAAYAAGDDLYVPGAVNKAMSWGTNLLPRSLVTRIAGTMMKMTGRDKG